MDLTPERIEEVQFRGSIKGYDRNEVDDFLDRVAAGFGRLQQQLNEALQRAERAEARAAQSEERLRAQPEPIEPAPVPQQVDPDAAADTAIQAAHRTLHMAQRTADAVVQEARDESERLLADARADAERLTSEASTTADRLRREAAADLEEQAEQARWRMAAEVDELEATRTSLMADIELLDGHLQAHGDQLRRTLDALRRGLDDPSSLRFPPPEGLSLAAAAPPANAYEPSYEAAAEPAPVVDWSQPVIEFVPVDEPAADEEELSFDYSPAPQYEPSTDYGAPADFPSGRPYTSSAEFAPPSNGASPPPVEPSAGHEPSPAPQFAPSSGFTAPPEFTPPPEPPQQFPPEPVVRVDGAPPRSYPDWLFTVDSSAGQAGNPPGVQPAGRPGYANAITDPTPVINLESGNGSGPGSERDTSETDDEFLTELRDAVGGDDRPAWQPSGGQGAPQPPPAPQNPPPPDPERWRFDRGH